VRRPLAAFALAAATSGVGTVSTATAAPTAPTVDDLEACVQRFPGDRAAERKACFEALVSPGPPASRPSVPAAPEARTVPTTDFRHEGGDSASQFRRLWGDAKERSAWRAGEYRTNYFLPAFRAKEPNLAPSRVGDPVPTATQADRQATEAKFQLSFKGHLWPKDERGNHDLWFGYTQVSHWQVWNAEASRPFRETSYEPELMYTYETPGLAWGGWRVGHVGLSLNHNSNGRGGDLSRSWNRVIAFARAEKDDTLVTLRAWSRIRESGPDDNPEIEDYYGRADLQVSHQFGSGVRLEATGRHSLRTGSRSRGAIQLDLSAPLCAGSWPGWMCVNSARLYVQGYHGYAESLIDYNYRDSYLGIGVSLGESR
jgi:phospholipase A1